MDKRFLVAAGIVAVLIIGIFIFMNSNDTTIKVTQSESLSNSPASSVAELKIEDLVVGTGAQVKSGDTITAHYTGKLMDGTQFDSSVGKSPFTTQIGVGNVIKGWDEGIVGMKVGGKRRLTIPSGMGYGETGSPPVIPPNASLIFDIELLEVK